MTVALMIWAAIGPILAFMVGVLVGSQDDEETPPPTSEYGWPIPAYPYAESWRQPPGDDGMAEIRLSIRVERTDPMRPWRLPGRAVEQPLPAAARPGGRCGSKGQWP